MRAACIIVLAGLVACGKPAPAPGSCYRAQENVCIEYGPEQGAAGKRLCAGLTWTPGASSCAAEGRLGRCVQADGARIYYGGAPNNYTTASAKAACEHAGGTWATP